MNSKEPHVGVMTYKDIDIYYRLSDDFVNANAICKLEDKLLSNWLRTDHAWKLFVARANQMGIDFDRSKKYRALHPCGMMFKEE